jgi:acyl carrier protein
MPRAGIRLSHLYTMFEESEWTMTSPVAFDATELRDLIADVLDVDPDAVTEQVHFAADLGVDSLLALEIAVTLERRYGVKIDWEDVVDVLTLRDVRDLVARKLADKA